MMTNSEELLHSARGFDLKVALECELFFVLCNIADPDYFVGAVRLECCWDNLPRISIGNREDSNVK